MLQPRIWLSKWPKGAIFRTYATEVSQISSAGRAYIPPTLASNPASLGSKASAPVPDSLMITYIPRTPGQRHLKRVNNPHLWPGGPWKPLTFPKVGHGKGGRNATGRVTVRHRGGGHRRRIRTVDFKQIKPGEQVVERIEYDPNRSAHLALLRHSRTGERSYMIAAVGMRAGDKVTSYRSGISKELLTEMGGKFDPGLFAAKTCVRGNTLPIKMVPPGTQVYCIGSAPDRGAVFCRSAGTFATVIGKFEEKNKDAIRNSAPMIPGMEVENYRFMVVKLQSGEIRRVHKDACATIGVVSNPLHRDQQLGKAGRARWLNIRPTVRGMAMNACDHPHGGGRGKSKGNRIPVSPWGTPAKSGYKTRSKRNPNKWVVQERPRNFGKRRSKK